MKLKLKKMNRFIAQQIPKSLTTLLSALLMLSFSSTAMAGWEMQWIDKFDGTGVNWDNWTAQTEASYNDEVQCYTADDSSDKKNYDVSNGTLKIIARKDENVCLTIEDPNKRNKTWTSGRLNSKDKQEFLYGRIESRIRFQPNAELLAGTWPAFWMLENLIAQQPIKGDGDNVAWPKSGAGEIDIWEWSSNIDLGNISPNRYITNFFNTGSNCGNEFQYTYLNGAADVQQWHTYAMEWTKDNISFYIDNIPVASQDVSNCSQYEEPMFVLLNVAMSGILGGTIDNSLQKATMEVDYVAHCQASTANSATYCNEALAGEDNGLLQVSINMTQNGQTITEINPNNGVVTLSAKSNNTVTGNSYSYVWKTDRLPSPITTGQQVNFDPSSMDDGYYYVSVTITDEQNSALTTSEYVILQVAGDDSPANPTQPSDQESISSSDSSGGSVNQLLLGCLALICLFRRRFKLA